MKNFLLTILTSCILSLISLPTHAQAGEWTWMKGKKTPNNPPVYGTQGIPDSTVNPPSVYEPVEWTDLQGNFWLFGGDGGGSTYADLWMFNIASNNWTWMKGPGAPNATADYGTQGVPAPGNNPGSRGWGALSWVDTAGNLWMFGGQGYGATLTLDFLGELWKYDAGTNEWTWVGGLNQLPDHGTLGMAAATNYPGARVETNASWVDEDNNLWFFGGISDIGMMNDLWEYEMSSGEWIWMKGSNTASQPATYGTLGVESASNVPGCRGTFSKWKDNLGNFWMFGGADYSSTVYNDFWRYDPASGNWTWMGGNNYANGNGEEGAKCEDSSVFISNARYENRACWTDACGNFWVLGGRDQNSNTYNDLWVYSVVLNKWAWVAGTLNQNSSGVYGTKGIPDPANYPGGRDGNVGWLNADGNLWMFGGKGYVSSYLNDLWRFTPDSSCLAWLFCYNSSPINFAAVSTTLCEKFCTGFIDSSTNNPTSWQWQFPGGDPSSSTLQNPTNICYDIPGTYDVTLITTNANGSDTLTLTNYITVHPTPPFPTITQAGYTLTSSVGSSYQWQFNSYDIPGATNQSYDVMQTGYYTVIVGDSNGCVNSATQYVLISGMDEVSDGVISIYPNPSSGNFIVEFSYAEASENRLLEIEVVNILGQKVFSSSEKISSADWKKEIDLHDAASGVYFIEIKSKNIFLKKKIIITK